VVCNVDDGDEAVDHPAASLELSPASCIRAGISVTARLRFNMPVAFLYPSSLLRERESRTHLYRGGLYRVVVIGPRTESMFSSMPVGTCSVELVLGFSCVFA